MTEPTAAEIKDLYAQETGFILDDSPAALLDFARAVLAKWGQPAHSGEPVAWKHDCAALLTNDVELWIDTCPHCGKPRNAPQPVEREPLTHAQAKALVLKYGNDPLHLVLQVERAHGIKGGQHGL